MGMLARYIDGLTDEQRDRIVRATEWPGDGGAISHVYPDGCRCLVGHAEDWFIDERGLRKRPDPSYNPDAYGFRCPSTVFPRLVKRFGLDRVVRACKARAARGNRTDLGEPTTDVPVSAGQHARL